MKRYVMNKDGSTLILLIITIAITTVLGASLLIVTMTNLKIKKANSEIRKSLYMSEAGLNEAYMDVYKLIGNGISDSLQKTQDYLLIYPLNKEEAIAIFSNNYKLYITGHIKSEITHNSNPSVQITNLGALIFNVDKLTVSLKSKYTNKSNIVKTTSVNLMIQVPDYNKAIANSIDVSSLLIFDKWVLSDK